MTDPDLDLGFWNCWSKHIMILSSPFSNACLSLVVFSLIGGIFLIGKEKCSTSGINVEGALHVLGGNFILPSPACSAKETESLSFTSRRQGQTNGSNYLGWLQCFSNTGFQTMKQSTYFLISKYHCLWGTPCFINSNLQMTHHQHLGRTAQRRTWSGGWWGGAVGQLHYHRHLETGLQVTGKIAEAVSVELVRHSPAVTPNSSWGRISSANQAQAQRPPGSG